MKLNWKNIACSLFLIFQLGMIIGAKFSSNRYFTWAPHDIQTSYKLRVVLDSVELPPEALYSRYGLYNVGIEDLPADHLIERFTEYERLHLSSNTESIKFEYSVNGKERHQWLYESNMEGNE